MSTSNSNPTVALAKALLKLFPVEIPFTSSDKSEIHKKLLDRARKEYEDEVSSGFGGYFANFNESIKGKTILDIGSGYGGRPIRYAELHAKSVTGIEISYLMNSIAINYTSAKGVKNVRFVTAVGENLPFESETFDMITTYDVLEHVQFARQTLRECFRVLKKRGRMFVVFPPYYSIYGSHLSGYISFLPFANILFSPKTLMLAIEQILEESGTRYRPMPLRPGDKLNTLNGLTIKRFKMGALAVGFTISSIVLAPINMPKITREMFSDLRSIFKKTTGLLICVMSGLLYNTPFFREAFTNKVICTLDKNV